MRILRPSGILYIGAPFILKLTPDPTDYYRFSSAGLLHLCRKFEIVGTGSNRGPASTMCDLMVRYLALVFCFNRAAAYYLLLDLFRWLLFWTKYLDRIIGCYELAAPLCGNPFVIAASRRRTPPSASRRPNRHGDGMTTAPSPPRLGARVSSGSSSRPRPWSPPGSSPPRLRHHSARHHLHGDHRDSGRDGVPRRHRAVPRSRRGRHQRLLLGDHDDRLEQSHFDRLHLCNPT